MHVAVANRRSPSRAPLAWLDARKSNLTHQGLAFDSHHHFRTMRNTVHSVGSVSLFVVSSYHRHRSTDVCCDEPPTLG